MKDRPILMSGEMVNAILAGKKTQTRRVMKPKPVEIGKHWEWRLPEVSYYMPRGGPNDALLGLWDCCPYGYPGDRLWVRETLIRGLERGQGHSIQHKATISPVPYAPGAKFGYYGYALWQWERTYVPSIHMPRWASRLTLEITGVRAERVQDISETDSIAEGLYAWQGANGKTHYGLSRADVWEQDPRLTFARLWDSINGKRAPWSENPWCWVVEFSQVAP